MKVLFAPNYFYLNFPLFAEVIGELKAQGSDALVLHAPGASPVPADSRFDREYMNRRGIRMCELPVHSRTLGWPRTVRAAMMAILNKSHIARLLDLETPDVVVVGSDLGNVNIRFLVDLCHERTIPVCVLYSCELPKLGQQASPIVGYFRKWLVARSPAGLLARARAVLFHGHIPGSYASHSSVVVISDEVREQLIAKGIAASRVIVADLSALPDEEGWEPPRSRSLPSTKPLKQAMVVMPHCPDGINAEKQERVFAALCEFAGSHAKDWSVIVKLHPRENAAAERTIRTRLSGHHLTVVGGEISGESMLRRVDAIIGVQSADVPRSRVLIQALAAGLRVAWLDIDYEQEESDASHDTEEIRMTRLAQDLTEFLTTVPEHSQDSAIRTTRRADARAPAKAIIEILKQAPREVNLQETPFRNRSPTTIG